MLYKAMLVRSREWPAYAVMGWWISPLRPHATKISHRPNIYIFLTLQRQVYCNGLSEHPLANRRLASRGQHVASQLSLTLNTAPSINAIRPVLTSPFKIMSVIRVQGAQLERHKVGSGVAAGMARKINGPSAYWQDYISCLLMHLFFPFLPLVLEYLLTDKIETKSLYLFAAIYPISIGISSYNYLQQNAAVVISLIFAAAYGVLVGGGPAMHHGEWTAAALLGVLVLVHAIERYNRHVVDRTPFRPNFKDREREKEAI